MWFSSKSRYRKLRKKFKIGDEVRVLGKPYSPYLQKDNRIGIIANDLHEEEFYDRYYSGFAYCLYMDKPVKYDPISKTGNVTVPDGYAYFVPSVYDLELVEPAAIQKPLDIWSFEPPKVEHEPQEDKIPPVWGNKVLA